MKFGHSIEYNKRNSLLQKMKKIMQKMRQGDNENEAEFQTAFFLKKALYEEESSGLQLSFSIF